MVAGGNPCLLVLPTSCSSCCSTSGATTLRYNRSRDLMAGGASDVAEEGQQVTPESPTALPCAAVNRSTQSSLCRERFRCFSSRAAHGPSSFPCWSKLPSTKAKLSHRPLERSGLLQNTQSSKFVTELRNTIRTADCIGRSTTGPFTEVPWLVVASTSANANNHRHPVYPACTCKPISAQTSSVAAPTAAVVTPEYDGLTDAYLRLQLLNGDAVYLQSTLVAEVRGPFPKKGVCVDLFPSICGQAPAR